MIEILYSMILLTVSFLVESTLDFDLEKIHMTCFLSDKPLLSFHFTPPMSFYQTQKEEGYKKKHLLMCVKGESHKNNIYIERTVSTVDQKYIALVG